MSHLQSAGEGERRRDAGRRNAVRVYDEAMEKGLGPEDWGATWKIVRGRA